jgi:ribosomal protein S18 acetylase RimI-like enzyme
MEAGAVVCWEALDPGDPSLEQARQLYESTLDPAERIPWRWIADAVSARAGWRPGGWSPHLLLAAPRRKRGAPGPVVGFAYGIHVPDYGGYACYLGVDPGQRRRGVGKRLLRLLIQVLRVDAACEGTALPFVVWESRQPPDDAPEEQWALWRVRLRLFERVGAWWIAGLTFMAPSFARGRERAVPLQLFLVPVDAAPDEFDVDRLRQVAAGLMRRVYGRNAGDSLFDETLCPTCRPTLQPVAALRASSPGPAA